MVSLYFLNCFKCWSPSIWVCLRGFTFLDSFALYLRCLYWVKRRFFSRFIGNGSIYFLTLGFLIPFSLCVIFRANCCLNDENSDEKNHVNIRNHVFKIKWKCVKFPRFSHSLQKDTVTSLNCDYLMHLL